MNKQVQVGTVIFAIFLIALGVVALLGNLNLLPFMVDQSQMFWGIAFAVFGLGFLATFISNINENWWAIIPSLTLLALAMLIAMPLFWAAIGGAMFLGMIGLSFLIIFLTGRQERWWAIIPGGALFTLAAVALISELPDGGWLAGGALFLGLALTFLVIYLVMRMKWALWPAGVLALMGSLFLLGVGNVGSLVFPTLLIATGAFLVFRAMRSQAG